MKPYNANRIRPVRHAVSLLLAGLLTACAGGGIAPLRPAAPLPAEWQATLPNEGRLQDLGNWWQQFDDPMLSRLIDAAQKASPDVAAARSRIRQARASRIGASAALLPQLDAQASASRAKQDLSLPLAGSASAGLQASWELDLFGARSAAADASQARLVAAHVQWHDARISVAAEVANSYVALRACEAELRQAEADAASRAETVRLTELATDSGFQSPANAALARASASQARASVSQQKAQCEIDVKALVALTALDEPVLRGEMALGVARVPQPAALAVARVPAQALAQRPDLVGAERELAAAGADIAESQAQRWPRVSLSGSIGGTRVESGGMTQNGAVWSLGPIAVTLPLFDAGARRANVDAARARYAAAESAYRGKLRGAVREVEAALVSLQSTAERSADAQIAADGFHASYLATQDRQRGGLASLFELEDARRSDLQAQTALIELQRERVLAWIALYRALGGGWNAGDADTDIDFDGAAFAAAH